MKKQTIKFLSVLALAASLMTLAACNRGYGCPTDMSLGIEQACGLE